MPDFIPAQIKQISPEMGKPVVGIALVGHPDIVAYASGQVTDGTSNLEVPLQFYSGDLELVRAELMQLVNNVIDALHEEFND